MNYTVRFKIAPDADIVYSSPLGMTVMEAAKQAGLDLDSPCAGNGSCGKCLVSVVTGGKEEQRLACQTKIESDLTVLVPEGLQVSASKMKIIDLHDERELRLFDSLRKELETLGFLETIDPDSCTEHAEEWYIMDNVSLPVSEADINGKVFSLIERIIKK